MTYTTAAALAVLCSVVLDVVVLRTRILVQQAFWISYAIILGFQLVTNGILTGRGVVRYDSSAILGARFVWAPVEDLAFGFALVVQTLSWWTFWGGYAFRRATARRVRPTTARRSKTR